MIKEAMQYLVSLKENKVYNIDGETYSDHDLVHIQNIDRPTQITVSGLDSLVSLISHEAELFSNLPLFVRVCTPCRVEVFSSLDGVMGRDHLYEAICDVPGFKDGYREYDRAIIELRSKYAPGDGVDYLLDLLASVSKESAVTSSDNGVSQTVEARQGISLKQRVAVKPRVPLRPFRTFQEVEQPESEFLVRLDGDGNVGLFEADGGMWKMEAKANVAAWLARELKNEISEGKAVVMI